MAEPLQAKRYFQPTREYFWQWAENTEVIEWTNGRTICYRDDLIGILQELVLVGFPRISPLLLVLFACSSKLSHEEITILQETGSNQSDPEMQDLIRSTVELLNLVSQLPEELRKGKRRIHLIGQLFQQQGFVYPPAELRNAVDELNSGRIDKSLLRPAELQSRNEMAEDLRCLARALLLHPELSSLENKLRTGISSPPSEAPLIVPDMTTPDLLDQLAEDARTLGIARLARRVLAVLSIPAHVQGSGDQPIGGISDISNRGNFDKLLLTELAYDDDLLMARLVNNEALYFRREAPPENPKQRRIILIDSSLRMWGIPRVFALSAGIACIRNVRKGTIASAYILAGNSYTEADLETKEGVLQSLEHMDHALHCGNSLSAFIRESVETRKNEYILITTEAQFHQAAFLKHYHEVNEQFSYVITVNGEGDLLLHQSLNGHLKLINSGKFDLETLLFAPREKALQNSPPFPTDITPPSFLNSHPSPLLYPETRIKTAGSRMHTWDKHGVIVVNESQRVLYMLSPHCGAIELLSGIEKGEYAFGRKDELIYMLCWNNNSKIYKFYLFDLVTGSKESSDLPWEIGAILNAHFESGVFWIQTEFNWFQFICEMPVRVARKALSEMKTPTVKPPDLRIFHQYVDRVCTILFHIQELYINERNELVFGKHFLNIRDGIHIKIAPAEKKHVRSKISHVLPDTIDLIGNKRVKFQVWQWPDGSQAMIDSRGLLHLKSRDNNIPEITIVLVLSRTSTAWADNGIIAGNEYYISRGKSSTIPVKEFRDQFIQRFIDNIA